MTAGVVHQATGSVHETPILMYAKSQEYLTWMNVAAYFRTVACIIREIQETYNYTFEITMINRRNKNTRPPLNVLFNS